MTPRTNPFRADCINNLPYIFEGANTADISLEVLLQNLVNLNYRAAIIGAHGRGKSTLLHYLADVLKARGWSTHYLKLDSTNRNLSDEDWQFLTNMGRQDFILLDGAEQLSFWRWKRFLRQARSAGGVLVTSHRSNLLPTLHECRSSPQLLHTLMVELSVEVTKSTELPQQLFEKHQGNIRAALRELYDLQN